MITRRRFVASAAALSVPLPALAQDRWSAVRERAGGMSQLHTILVAQGADTVLAEAFRGPGLEALANVKSVSKTIVATLTGVVIDTGALPGAEATLGEVAPGLIPQGADERVAGITVENLLTMQAGVERTSGPNYGEWISSSNWVTDALSRDMIAEPGARMLYSTGSYHVLGAVLSEATGESLLSMARTHLGRPLGIDIPPWTQDPQGRYMGGNQMAMTPRAMLRFGEMIRQGGIWDGSQVVPRDWIETSMQPRTNSPFSGMNYGYGWFLGESAAGRFALARGYGGQVICLLPEREATVVVTSDPTLPARSGGYFGDLIDLIDGPVADALA